MSDVAILAVEATSPGKMDERARVSLSTWCSTASYRAGERFAADQASVTSTKAAVTSSGSRPAKNMTLLSLRQTKIERPVFEPISSWVTICDDFGLRVSLLSVVAAEMEKPFLSSLMAGREEPRTP